MQAVVDTFESGFEKYPDFRIDMEKSFYSDRSQVAMPPCGCHASFYGASADIAIDGQDYGYFADILAENLGFISSWELISWARDNPQIWGNSYGYDMFADADAIGGYFDPIFEHWQGVLERFIEHEE